MLQIKRGPGRPKKVRPMIKNKHILSIEEHLLGCSRKDTDSVIYVGTLVERALLGEIGAVIKALTAGRVAAELGSNKDGKLPADRILGRVEMADSLWNDLEQFVIDKDILLRPILDATKIPESVTEAEPRQTEEVYSP